MSASPKSPVPPVAVVLAAGQGKRMRSARPKVLHQAAGKPLLAWVLDAARAAGCARLLVVVGHGASAVRSALDAPDVVWVEQEQQLGTGHALLMTRPHVAAAGPLLVLSGDAPLVRPATLLRLLECAAGGWGAMAVAELAEAASLGRVLTRANGDLERIVEASDARAEELVIRRVNAGLYVLPTPQIFDYLAALRPNNRQGELYLTDALGGAAAAGRSVRTVLLADPDEARGVNDRRELAQIHRRLVERRIEALALAGATFLEPATTTVEAEVEVGCDAIVHGGVTLAGRTTLGPGVVVQAGAWIRDSIIEGEAVIEPYSVLDGARVGPGCRVGPFARLRPGAVLEAGAKVGNYVEVKNARLGAGAKANHLAYVGDAEVGARANLGAGVVTCNYDGVAKHKTEIGEGAFIGSDTMLVAPVKVGARATTGAGSVITRDVPDGALAVERSPQRNLPGWDRRRPRAKKEE